MSDRVVIIGGGISGTATAYELARNGVSVTLLERGELASMASGWTLAGVRQSGRHPSELPLAAAAVARWAVLDTELEADTEYRQNGNLRLALSEADIPTIRGVVEASAAEGIPIDYLETLQEIHDIAPALGDRIFGASYCPSDGHANPTKSVLAFAAAAKRHGASIRTGVDVTGISTASGRITGIETSEGPVGADIVIVAAGVYTPRLLEPLGLHLPLRLCHVPVVQTVPSPPMLDQVIGIAAGTFAGRQQVDGRFRLTLGNSPWNGGEWHDSYNVQPTMEQVRETIEVSTAILPALRGLRVAQVWGGLLDLTPDALPVIERSKEVDGLIIAAGFSGHGFCLGPVTGQILADMAVFGSTELPIEPFQLSRFADRSSESESLTLHG
ncbi:MAG TPA: FAD-binding oxidoreductase [Thermomicrobiales bacterium]|nr:FAD-binding oxidoreductase [Thermomicrobiales bacterium]